MATNHSSSHASLRRCRLALFGAAWLMAPQFCMAQTSRANAQPPGTERERTAQTASDATPLTEREPAEWSQLNGNLQYLVVKLVTQISAGVPATAPDAKRQSPQGASGAPANNAIASTADPASATRNREPKPTIAQSPSRAASSGEYLFNDAPFHLTNYIQIFLAHLSILTVTGPARCSIQ